MPLALVTDFLIPGGVTTFIRNLGSGLCEIGVQTKLPVVVLERTDPSEVLAMPDCEVHALDRTMPRAIREDRLAAAHRILGGLQPAGVIAALGMWSFEMLRYIPPGVARIAMVQSDDPLVYRTLQPYRPYLDHLVGVSPEITRRAVGEFGFPREIVQTIPYGVPYQDLPRPPGAEPQTLRLLYLGRIIEEQKRVSRLVELVYALDQDAAPFRLTIAGEGPARADLQNRLGSHPKIRFTGQVPCDKVPELLVQHDFFVLLSDYEGMPLGILEAAGYGVVPVVGKLPGFAEWLPDDIAIYVDLQSIDWPDNLASSVSSCKNDLLTRKARCRAWARKHFYAARMAEAYEALIPASRVSPWPKTQVLAPLAPGLQNLIYTTALRYFRRLAKRLRPGVSYLLAL
jgi:glycosyltransferase involved in cell wall biosynthesis